MEETKPQLDISHHQMKISVLGMGERGLMETPNKLCYFQSSPQSDGKTLFLKTIHILLNMEKSRNLHPYRLVFMVW